MTRSLSQALCATGAMLMPILFAAPALGANQTRSFVVSAFYPATVYNADTCPDGLNPLPDVFFKRDLTLLGVPRAEVDAKFDQDYNRQNGKNQTDWVRVAATRGNGRDDVYQHPTSVPDAHLKPAVGRYAYGFNLDGRGAATPASYEDPQSHEQGVNNQLFRALGCISAYKGQPGPQAPLEPEYRWGSTQAAMGAWLVSVTSADLTQDGTVTVTLESSIDAVTTQDANAQVQADMTYRVRTDSRTRHILHGYQKDGVITTEAASIDMPCDSYIQPNYEFHGARLRLKLRPDGRLDGVLGGYQPWEQIYWSHAKVGYVDERGFGIDVPALYYALKRDADAEPDPKSGQNTAISAAYLLNAVPAFVVAVDAPQTRSRAVPSQAAAVPREPRCDSLTGCMTRLSTAFAAATGPREPLLPGAAPLARRLRPEQYRRVIADVFGPTIRVEGRFEPDVREDGLFAIGVGRVGVTATGLEQYDALARDVASQVVNESNRGTLIPCAPQSIGAPDDGCARAFFAKAVPLLYRRPLSVGELEGLVALARSSAGALGSFYAGLQMSLAGVLESPDFLFRRESAEADPQAPGSYRMDAFSKASNLSFLLWNSGPDARLLAAAADGRLGTPDGLSAEVDRMLRSPRLEAGVRAFFSDMLQFDLFDTLAKDPQLYPKWTIKVAQDAQEQTLRTIVNLLVVERGDYRDLFTTRQTFLTPLLGSVYGLPVQAGAAPYAATRLVAGDPRAGIHAEASFVALHAHEGVSSPTLRGKAVRELLLCEPVPAPPGNVNFAAAQDIHNPDFKTMRERLTAHRNDPSCAGCHKLMDPMGLALENFAADGGYRTTENGVPLDTRGELDGLEFDDAAGLGRALHDNPGTGACLVRRLYSYATGRTATRRDMPWLRYLESSFRDANYRTTDLLRRIALSPNFYKLNVEPPLPDARTAQNQGEPRP
jgi:hypothetical protein